MHVPHKISTTLVVAALVGLTACSSGAGEGNSDHAQNLSGRGPINYVQGKDINGVVRPVIDRWNAGHPNEQVTLKEQSEQADQQHDDLVRHLQSKDPHYDVVSVDVVWTAEFAAQGWLQPLAGRLAVDTSQMLPPTVKTATYQNTLYASPVISDGGLLFYRKDLLSSPPTTWTELTADCAIAQQHGIGCYTGQFAKYEGLTVNVAEAIDGAGGEIVKSDGKTPDVDSPRGRLGLSALVDAYAKGQIPKEDITFQEEQARQAFESGNSLFMRNWPYAFSLLTTDGGSAVMDRFAVAPLPGIDGPGRSALGGHNAAISVYSQHKATAHDFLQYLSSEETQRFFANRGSLAPVLSALYGDQQLVQKLPYLPALRTSIETADPRPVTPYYPAVTRAVQDNAYAAIEGQKPVDQALQDMQAAIRTATGG